MISFLEEQSSWLQFFTAQYEPFKAMIVIENGSAQYSKH